MRINQETRRRALSPLNRLQIVLLVLALVPVLTMWAARTANVVTDGWFGDKSVAAVGNDFAVFYTAGHLIVDGAPELLYASTEFADAYGRVTGRDPASIGLLFGNPPAYAVAMAPLALLPIEAAWLLWSAISLAALVLSARGFGIAPRGIFAWLVLISAPGAYALLSGQNTFISLLVASGVFWALNRNKVVLAGAIAGLLALKPPLLLGFVLWWLVDKRMRRAFKAAALTAAVTCVATLPITQMAWLDYPRAVLGFAAEHRSAPGRLSQYSPWGFVDLIAPDYPQIALAVGIVASLAGVLAFFAYYRKHRDDWRLLFAGAVVTNLWISPHTLSHDWMLLIAALAALWVARPEQRAQWGLAAAMLSALSYWSARATVWSVGEMGWAVQLAVIGLPIVAWQVNRTLMQADADGENGHRSPSTETSQETPIGAEFPQRGQPDLESLPDQPRPVADIEVVIDLTEENVAR